MGKEKLFRTMESYRSGDVPWQGGRAWGYVYDAGAEVSEVGKQAYAMFLSENGLDPTQFPSLLRFENDLVGMAAAHLGGGERVAGNFTSGGTESILLAVKTARDHARAERPEVHEPEMVLPVTAHAAFHKAAHYLGVKVVPVPVDAETFKADPAAVAEAVTDQTILLVGSAPSYAHGVMDPIEELGRIALERGLLLHVDACIGGFLLPYFRRLGAEVPPFDLSVPGVTSISMDLHKYAYAPKGASLVLYRDKELRKHQIFSCSTWSGYSVVNPTVQSSKSGGPLAAAWAVLHFVGDDGYLEIARGLLDASRALVEGIGAIDGLRILGRPEMSLIAFTADDVGVFHIVDEMSSRGWYVQAQLAYGDSPENIHLTVAPSNTPWVDELLIDLRASVETAKALASSELASVVRNAFSSVDPATMGPEVLSQMLGMAGITGVDLPDRMAEVNEVLNALPSALSERLLSEFINELFTAAP
jgi:sphinganine-1-phosphate aldolase